MTRARQTVQYGLAAATALFAALLIYEIVAPLPDFDPPMFRLKPRAPRIANVAAVVTPSPEAFAEIATRPPFEPGRRGSTAAAADVSAAPPDLVLVGVIVDGTNSLALIKTASAPLAAAYRVGAVVSGWQVTEISPDHVVIGSGGVRSEIHLQANKSTPQATPTPTPLNSQ